MLTFHLTEGGHAPYPVLNCTAAYASSHLLSFRPTRSAHRTHHRPNPEDWGTANLARPEIVIRRDWFPTGVHTPSCWGTNWMMKCSLRLDSAICVGSLKWQHHIHPPHFQSIEDGLTPALSVVPAHESTHRMVRAHSHDVFQAAL